MAILPPSAPACPDADCYFSRAGMRADHSLVRAIYLLESPWDLGPGAALLPRQWFACNVVNGLRPKAFTISPGTANDDVRRTNGSSQFRASRAIQAELVAISCARNICAQLAALTGLSHETSSVRKVETR